MSTGENVVFFAGLAVVFGYPLGFFVAGGLWFLLILYVLLATAFAVSLRRLLCSRCINFACQLNGVPEPVRMAFRNQNPRIRHAWEAGQ
jgi:hypothetical protein